MASAKYKRTFNKRSRTKRGNAVVSKGWAKKGMSKVEKSLNYKTKTGQRRRMIITTTKKIIKR